jgi:hypothetical protein
MNQEITTPKSCPCKLITWNLSTNTAAEYGDLKALLQRETKQQTERNSSPLGFNTPEPLHLAAQHGHVSVVAYLLNKGYDANSGLCETASTELNVAMTTSTPPLHRCCFSGSLGCIQLLLDNGANISQKDHSFGDEMTPLHKAVKGGRYRAVALLMSFMKHNGTLKSALLDRDKQNRTPLDLAIELKQLGQDEILSLRRWDIIAGGPADFSKCIHLLQNASASEETTDPHKYSTTHIATGESSITKLQMYPNYCNCKNDIMDCNSTLFWEKAFQRAIAESTNEMLQRNNVYVQENKNFTLETNNIILLRSTKLQPKNHETDFKQIESGQKLGQACQRCGKTSIVLFRSSGRLVCRACRK